jgi:RNA:NAD 2'-phosphotransferase (TPT1/KptA family)
MSVHSVASRGRDGGHDINLTIFFRLCGWTDSSSSLVSRLERGKHPRTPEIVSHLCEEAPDGRVPLQTVRGKHGHQVHERVDAVHKVSHVVLKGKGDFDA